MNSDYVRDLQAWIHYVNGWMSFWNAVDLACFVVAFVWLMYLTTVIHRKGRKE